MVALTDSFSKAQFGFLSGRCTTQQLLLFFNSICESVDSKSQVDVIYLDFAKAFDSVPHNELLAKLHSMGVTGTLWKWFQGYLKERQQCVCVGNCRSRLLPVVSGVPQGSILGPLLFLLYVNDLPKSVKNSLLMLFADDAKCSKKVSKPDHCVDLQRDLDSLGNWSREWKLVFKAPKCVHLRFCRRDPPIESSYTIGDTQVSISSTHRDLGVIASSDLTWSAHYRHIASQAYKTLGLLRRTFRSADSVTAKRILYITLIRTQILYGSQVWRPFMIKDISLLERIQRRATKYILNDYTSDYKTRLISLDILPLMAELEIGDLTFFLRNLKTPGDHFDVTRHLHFSNKSTRSATHKKLTQVRSETTHARNTFFNRLPRLWNSLPPLDPEASLECNKKRLKIIFKDNFIENFDPSITCTHHYICPCHRCSHSPKPANFS